jgi:hypothetical protein
LSLTNSTNQSPQTARLRDEANSAFPAPQLFRIKPKRFKLPVPLGRWITEPFDTDAAGQAAFYGCFDKIGREESQRDGHVNLPNAALLAHAKLSDRSYPTRDHIIEPLTTAGDGAHEARSALELLRTDVASRCIMREQDLARPSGGRLLPGIVSDRVSGESDASSASTDLRLMISLSLCTTIPVTISDIVSRSPKFSALVVALPWLAARYCFRNFTTVFSISAAGMRETDPADAFLASPCRTGVDA